MSAVEFLTVAQVSSRTGADPVWIRRIVRLRIGGVWGFTLRGQCVIPSDQLPKIQELSFLRKKQRMARVAGIELLEDLNNGKILFCPQGA